MNKELIEEIKKLMNAFPKSFINSQFELILNENKNIFINLNTINTPLELKVRLIKLLSYFWTKDDDSDIKKLKNYTNQYLERKFSKQDFKYLGEEIYVKNKTHLVEDFIKVNFNFFVFKGEE